MIDLSCSDTTPKYLSNPIFESNIANTVFVFDLDDTLYFEADYQISGYNAVAFWLDNVYGSNIVQQLPSLLSKNNPDLLGLFCNILGFPLSFKQTLLWIYRLHTPIITINPDVTSLLEQLSVQSAGVAILTDGRSLTQRLKLKALCISSYPVYISEEYSDLKPSKKRFQLIMKHFPASNYVYIGDNPVKDFLAPNLLGWNSICLLGGSKNIHSQSTKGLSSEFLPDFYIHTLNDLNLFFK